MTKKNYTSENQAQCAIQNVTRSFEGWTKFNLNHKCIVKPNDRGREAYIKHWMTIFTREQAEEHYAKNIDKDGYMEMQLWCAMEYFGDAMCAGIGSLHADEFYLETERLKNCG